MSRIAPLALAVAAAISPRVLAQPAAESGYEQKVFRAVHVDTAPVVDGRLDDAVWELAEPLGDFHQIRPGDGAAASEPTEVYVVYTDDALYIGARMAHHDPAQIVAPTIRHGQGLNTDDRLVIILDPFNTKRTGYRFMTNLNGVRHEALYQSINAFNQDWSTIWDTAAAAYEDGWIAEVEIPFKSLPFDPNTEVWGFNFGRSIRHRGEELAWVSYNRTYNPSISGQMTGMSGMNQGVGLDIVPSFSMTQAKRFNPDTSAVNEQPSLDAFYRLTPSLNAALTINTDFSATEVDNRQVNLTRFNLFFPEKRDFFLNDSDLFQFGNISGNSNSVMGAASRENARPYFSRKIGLSATGMPVDINYGGRISGRVGRWNIGTLAIRQDEFNAVDSRNLFVARGSANIMAESNLGFIVTSGNPSSNLDNSVFGADFRYLNTRLASGKVIEGDVFYQVSDTTGLEDDDAAWGLSLRSPNNSGFKGGASIKEVQRNFNPAMGYINRTDIRDYFADVGYMRFFNSGPFQTAFAGIDMERIENIGGGLQSEYIQYRPLELETNVRDRVWLQYQQNREVVVAPFRLYSEPGRQVVMTPGDYSFNEMTFGVGTSPQRQFSGQLNYTTGDFYTGERDNYNVSFNWNQSRHFLMGLQYDWNDIKLPEGNFTTRLASLSTQVGFSPTLFWVSLVQYDNVSEEIGINTRLQWIPEAGQEGFVVLNYNMQDKDKNDIFHAAVADFSVKFKYTFRY